MGNCPNCPITDCIAELKSGKDLPEAVKFTDMEIPIENVNFRAMPDGKTNPVWLPISLDIIKTEIKPYMNTVAETANVSIRMLKRWSDKLDECIAACGGGK